MIMNFLSLINDIGIALLPGNAFGIEPKYRVDLNFYLNF